MLNVSTLVGSRRSSSDALRYGATRSDEAAPSSARQRRPVVVWNITKSCNLACRHCYASAKRTPDPHELDSSEALALVKSLASYEVPALLLSGGEPTVRPDFWNILHTASSGGLKVTISTNGTLIDGDFARRLAEVGVTYVGVSLDGPAELHDRLRCARGAWEMSVAALRALGQAGVRRGIRFTLTPWTLGGLRSVLDTVTSLGVERFCMYHLVPSGRGQRISDVTPRQRLAALHEVFEFAISKPGIEVLTVANPSDAVALYLWLKNRHPRRAHAALEMLRWNGGARNGSGVGLACIDEKGIVYPDQFSRHRPIGSVRHQLFDDLWERWIKQRGADGATPRLPSECLSCGYFDICGGGFRARAELATGDPAGFDPSCIAAEAVEEAA